MSNGTQQQFDWTKTLKLLGEYQCNYSDGYAFDKVQIHADGDVFTVSEGRGEQPANELLRGCSFDESIFGPEPVDISNTFAWGLVLYDSGSWYESLTEFPYDVQLLDINRGPGGTAFFDVDLSGERQRIAGSIIDEDGQWNREILRRVVIEAMAQRRRAKRK